MTVEILEEKRSLGELKSQREKILFLIRKFQHTGIDGVTAREIKKYGNLIAEGSTIRRALKNLYDDGQVARYKRICTCERRNCGSCRHQKRVYAYLAPER